MSESSKPSQGGAFRSFNTPYGAYHVREIPPPDDELTRVGPGTACGEYLRRFWQPVAFTRDLADVPLRIRIMGEDLVLFRDLSGRSGLLQLHCAHRGTSLEYGLPSERGLRCCYHGWLYDIDGRVLETPGEPAGSTLKDRICQGAYPTHEFHGMIFAYMGPPERRPEFPIYDTFDLPGYRLEPAAKFTLPCNWLQVKDNSMDPAHTAFLHARSSGTQFTDAFAELPELDWVETSFGMVYIATRRVGDNVWVRICDFMPPNVHQFTREIEEATEERAASRPVIIRWAVPIDDTSTVNIEFAQVDPRWNLSAETITRPGFGQSDDRPYAERQRHPADYDAQSSQRPIAVHALEHLGFTDKGVLMLRRIVRDGIRDVAAGRDPFGVSRVLSASAGDVSGVRDASIAREVSGAHDAAGSRVIRTFTQDTVLRIPAESDPADDRRLLRETGRKIVSAG